VRSEREGKNTARVQERSNVGDFDPPRSANSRPMKTNDSDQLGSVSAQVGMKNPGPGPGRGLGAGKRHAQRAAGPGHLAPWAGLVAELRMGA
jgi:hypothetical protein